MVVREGAQYSGSAITARPAMEFGREVCGLPGNATQLTSFGPNQLIKPGAKLVACWEDVIEQLPRPIRAELLPVEFDHLQVGALSEADLIRLGTVGIPNLDNPTSDP